MASRYRPIILLNDAFQYAYGSVTHKGIFSILAQFDTQHVIPWNPLGSNSYLMLDAEYHFNHSGQKKISPLLYNLLDDDNHIPSTAYTILSKLIWQQFMVNWQYLWDTYYLPERNLFNDTSITETGTDSSTTSGTNSRTSSSSRTGTDNLSDVHGHMKTGSDALLHGEVVTTRDTGSQTAQNSRYGFNSDEAVPSDESSVSVTGTQTNEHNGTDTRTTSETNSGTDQHNRTLNLSDSGSESGTHSKTDSGSYSKTRTGLSGTRSFQELIQQERALWVPGYFEKVFSDLDSVLASPVYNRTHPVNPYSVYPFGYYNI